MKSKRTSVESSRWRPQSWLAVSWLVLSCMAIAGCPAEEPQTEDLPVTFPDFGTVDNGSGDVGGGDDAPGGIDSTPDLSITDTSDGGPGDPDTSDVGQEIVGTDALDIPDNPPPPDIQPDGPCVPDCDDRICGNDGCGGICGYCTYPTVCDPAGQCAVVCEPDCDGKFCGGDGCGASCGECVDDLECGEDGICYEPTCVPDCTGKVCGSDGCGADCGTCVSPDVCTAGSCQLGPCGTVTDTGKCDGALLQWCEGGDVLNQDDCSQYPGYSCTYDGQLNKYTCKDTGPCVTTCGTKKCGSDGCGSTCGTCNNNWSCVVGVCTPEEGAACGAYQNSNYCAGDTWWYCQPSNTLTAIECNVPPFYEKCEFDITTSKYGCVEQ